MAFPPRSAPRRPRTARDAHRARGRAGVDAPPSGVLRVHGPDARHAGRGAAAVQRGRGGLPRQLSCPVSCRWSKMSLSTAETRPRSAYVSHAISSISLLAARVLRRVAGHPDQGARVAVRLRLEHPRRGDRRRRDRDVEFLVDLADERVGVRFARLAFAAREVVDVLAARARAEDAAADRVQPGDLVDHRSSPVLCRWSKISWATRETRGRSAWVSQAISSISLLALSVPR